MQQLPTGTKVGGDFEVIRLLGAGGMGAVYLARQVSTGAPRALKVMLESHQKDPGFVRRFAQEAQIGAGIDSEHIVHVLSAGVDEALQLPWLAMEYLEGTTLGGAMASFGVPSETDATTLLEQLWHAVSAAHTARVVHRDLKPENLFLARSKSPGQPFTLKVLDFGIAKWFARGRGETTVRLLSPLWAAPEQSIVGFKVGPQADVWALGLLVFWLFTGEVFWRIAEDSRASNLEVLMNDIPAASRRAAELGCARVLPPSFDHWFSRCVAPDPAQRYADAASAAEDFRKLQLSWPAKALPWRLDSTLEYSATAPVESGRPRPAAQAHDLTETPTPAPDTPTLPPGHAQTAPPRGTSPQTTPPESTSGAHRNPPVLSGPQEAAANTAPQDEHRRWLWPGIWGLGLVTAGLSLFATHALKSPAGSTNQQAIAHLSATTQPEKPPPEHMRRIPAGSFSMGAKPDTPANATTHVTFPHPFLLDAREVSVKEYQECEAAERCSRSAYVGHSEVEQQLQYEQLCNEQHPGRQDHPINCVTRAQAIDFCNFRGARLPTEAEWEYAARGSDGRLYPWGAQPPNNCEMAVISGLCNPQMTRPVGTRSASALSPFGVADLAGNVWEWVQDEWEQDRHGGQALTNPVLRPGSERGVVRGGGWDTKEARVTSRRQATASSSDVNIGFRCARDGQGKPTAIATPPTSITATPTSPKQRNLAGVE